MKAFLKLILVIIILAIISAVVYGLYWISQKDTSVPVPLSVSMPVISTSTPTSTSMASSTPVLYATTTKDMSDWKSYSNASRNSLKSGTFSVKYPADLILSGSDDALVLVFPKETYFHWPLQDDVKVTVVASSTCPAITVPASEPSVPRSKIPIGGLNFQRIQGDDAAVGNRYEEIVFDTVQKHVCYHLSLYDHGTDGAGFYVSDSGLVVKYDAIHSEDMAKILDIFYGIVGSLSISKR